MDKSFLRKHTARCRSLADFSNDPFIKKRLLDLADRYEGMLLGKPSRAAQSIKPPSEALKPTLPIKRPGRKTKKKRVAHGRSHKFSGQAES
jgi:hypothetical protein